MTKLEQIKEEQGFIKHFPCCGNCINFISNKEITTASCTYYTNEALLRCKLGNFKVIKSNYCAKHNFKEDISK